MSKIHDYEKFCREGQGIESSMIELYVGCLHRMQIGLCGGIPYLEIQTERNHPDMHSDKTALQAIACVRELLGEGNFELVTPEIAEGSQTDLSGVATLYVVGDVKRAIERLVEQTEGYLAPLTTSFRQISGGAQAQTGFELNMP